MTATTFAIKKYKQSLNEGEISNLRRKEALEKRQYYVAYRALMVLSFIIPFITSWYRAYEGAPNAFSYVRFFVTTFILLGISTLATYGSYHHFHKGLKRDIKEGTKTIETNRITKKMFVPGKNTYYFYTTSTVKLSIEVSAEYYSSMKEGEDICIEYTTHSQIYLGYF